MASSLRLSTRALRAVPYTPLRASAFNGFRAYSTGKTQVRTLRFSVPSE
jgi:hypothetical protein